MIEGFGSIERNELQQVIRSVRNRWRLRVTLRGLAMVLAGGLLAFLLFTFVMDQFRYSPTAIIIVRALTVLALVGLVVRYLILPLTRRISDEQIALYIEEYDPSLKTALLSAVEFSSKIDSLEATGGSPDLVRGLIKSVVKKCYLAAYDVSVGRQALNRAAVWFMVVTMLSALLVILSPPFIRYGARAIVMWGEEEAVNPYSLQVSPGDTTLSRGADQQIEARLIGFNSDRAVISMRQEEGADWERWPMIAGEATNDYLFMMFDLSSDLEYFVESSGVRSETYSIEVKERPFVDHMELEYRFPAYTRLPRQVIQNSGDIAAPPGTEVHFTITSTMAVSGGDIRIEGGDPIHLVVDADSSLSGALTVREQGVYRIDLFDMTGTAYIASPDYLIDVLADRSPTVWFSEPGRDIQVTSIEEVYVEVGAEDDYGMNSLEIVYSVNGGTENVIELVSPRGEPMQEVTAGHTFFLEEYALEAGDIISYYARVNDRNSIKGPQDAASDIYFLDIRPFGRDYRESQQQGGAPQGGGAGGQQNAASGLSRQQRDIIAATFNLIRDRDQYTDAEYNENLATLALLQGQLAEQVGSSMERLAGAGRMGGAGSELEQIVDAMGQARTEMTEAESRLGERDPEGAMPPEQRALRHLQRAEAVIRDVQVSRGQQQSGGGGFAGGGGQQSQAENLADLLDLELDRARNQYETVRRGQQQQTDEQVDEALEKLRELAQRQQQEIDRQRRLAATNQNMSGGMGGSQRQLAEQAEELARQLERLARENSRTDLMESARRLQESAEEMRRSASRSGNQASERGQEALAQLEEARRLLERDQQNRLQRDIDDAVRRAEAIAESEESIQRVIENMPEQPSERTGDVIRLIDRKDEMSQELDDLERDLDRMAAYSRNEDREASRELTETSNSMRTNRLQDKVRFSKGVIQQRSTEYAEFFEEQISSDIDEMRERLGEAARAASGAESNQSDEMLERARDIMRDMESLQRRSEQRAAQNAEQQRGLQQGQQQGQQQSGQQQGQQQGGQQQGQQQSGQQQGQQRGGQQQGQQRGLGEDRQQQSNALGGGGGPGIGPLTMQDIRQFNREYQERAEDVRELIEDMQNADQDTDDLESILNRLEQLERTPIYDDPEEVARLQTEVLEDMKQFEFGLRRELGVDDQERLFLTGNDEVPAGFRKYVEDYFRALSRKPPAGRPPASEPPPE